MIQLYEYLLSKTRKPASKYFEFFISEVIDKNDSYALEMIHRLDDVPEDFRETLFDALCQFYNKGYEVTFRSKNFKTESLELKDDSKKIEFNYIGQQFHIFIYNMKGRKISGIIIFPSEYEIDWYLETNIDVEKTIRIYETNKYINLAGKFRKTWMFNEIDKANELKNIYDETI